MREHTGGFGFAPRRDELGVEALLSLSLHFAVAGLGSQVRGERAFGEPLNALTAFGLVPCLRHVGMAAGEELFFLQFDAFPRRIGQHAGETAGGMHQRKSQRPMQYAGLSAGRASNIALFDLARSGMFAQQF